MAVPFDDIATACKEFIVPNVVNNVYKNNPIAYKYLRTAKEWNGGHKYERPIVQAKNTNAQAYAAGGSLTVTRLAELTKAQWTPRQYNAAVTLYGIDFEENKGAGKVFDLVAEKFELAEESLKDLFGTHFYLGGTTTEIDGLSDISGKTGAETYAGINAATDVTTWKCSSLSGWAAGPDTATDTLTLAKFAKIYIACSLDNDQPTDIVTTSSLWGDIEGTLLESKLQYISRDLKMAQLGFENFRYRNATMFYDSHCPSTSVFWLNAKHLYFAVFPGMKFKFIPWQTTANKDEKTAHIRWYGNLICDARWSLGRQTGITTITA